MLDLLLFGQKTSPDFFWDARSGVQPPGSTFTAASTRWAWNSSGVLVPFSSNVPRFDYDPATLQPWGYLAEPQSTNGVTQSQTFSTWAVERAGLATNAAVAPDGTTTATAITPTNVAGTHDVFFTASATSGDSIGFSVFAKAGTGFTNIAIGTGAQTASYAVAVCDLQNGVVGETKTGGGGTISASIRNVGGGWYRCSVVVSNTDTTNRTHFISPVPLATGNTYTGGGQPTFTPNGTDFLYIWGAQKDTVGVGVTSYIPTTTAAVTRAQDLLSLPLTSLPGWSTSKGGVLVATYRANSPAPNFSQFIFSLTDGTLSNIIGFNDAIGLDSRTFFFMNTGGVGQFNATGSNPPLNTRRKMAAGWSAAHASLAENGVLASTFSGSYAIPTTTTLNIGSRNGTDSFLSGTIESIAYYAGARSDAFVQAVSR